MVENIDATLVLETQIEELEPITAPASFGPHRHESNVLGKFELRIATMSTSLSLNKGISSRQKFPLLA